MFIKWPLLRILKSKIIHDLFCEYYKTTKPFYDERLDGRARIYSCGVTEDRHESESAVSRVSGQHPPASSAGTRQVPAAAASHRLQSRSLRSSPPQRATRCKSSPPLASGCVVECRICNREVAGGFESQPGLLRTKVYSAFHPSGVGK